jgi:hypothetical protein
MTKAKLAALEKVFAAEIDNRLPFQSKAKIYQQLQDDGYLEPMERRFAGDRFGVVVTGYQLSHAGRLEYCLSCSDPRT